MSFTQDFTIANFDTGSYTFPPSIAFFNISAHNLDPNDAEIPVVVSKENTTDLYLNGKLAAKLEKGEVPDFHVFFGLVVVLNIP